MLVRAPGTDRQTWDATSLDRRSLTPVQLQAHTNTSVLIYPNLTQLCSASDGLRGCKIGTRFLMNDFKIGGILALLLTLVRTTLRTC